MDNGAKINVLVVEDHYINQELMCDLLKYLKCSVEIACNGKEAVQRVEESHFDLIFMDLQMPEMDGFEASRRIRKFHKEIPIVALTANHLNGDLQRCYDAGMSDYLTKPFEIQDIESVIQKYF